MAASDALNPRQHKEFIFTRDTDDTASMGMDDYKLIKRTLHETGEIEHHQVGNLMTNRYRGRNEHFDQPPTSPAAYDEKWYRRGGSTSTPVRQKKTTPRGIDYTEKVGSQGRLFPYYPAEPPRHVVDLFTGTHENRAANMVMLGLAENYARSEGTTLQPSEDLSKHSSRLVEHLQGKGAVSSEALTGVTNRIQFTEPYKTGALSVSEPRRVPQEEVEAGRKTVREVVRGDNPRQVKGQQRLF